jgi:hypothetical protein
MNPPLPLADGSAALHSGRTCAVAVQGQRDLQGCVAEYPGLFPVPPFDGAVFASLAMANAFSAPELSARALRTVNRTSLWAFRVDWLFDHLATSRAEVAAVAQRCLAVAAGATPESGDTLALFLADLRRELATGPDFPDLSGPWLDELTRMFEAMLREWDWRAGGDRPGVDEYLDNADNLGSSFVDLSHWLANPEPASVHGGPKDVEAVLAATRAGQRVIRVVNDLASIERDLRSGDLNLLRLMPDRAEVTLLLAALTADADAALTTLHRTQPALAGFLRRQVEFCRGFYDRTDYWGDV